MPTLHSQAAFLPVFVAKLFFSHPTTFMKIIDIRTMRGPSYWSVKHTKLIVMKVDLEEFAGTWSNAIPELPAKFMQLFPKIGQPQPGGISGRPSPKHPPLNEDQLNDGEPLGHVIQHVALELQRMAGMPVYWGKSTLR